MQYEDDNVHVPFWQRWEQHSLLAAQGLPAVLHATLSGTQMAAAQVPLQQVADEVQAALSARQVDTLDAQIPPMQERLQQSVANWHGKPGSKHDATDDPQVPVLVSHSPEQQISPPMHETPAPTQEDGVSMADASSPYRGSTISPANHASPPAFRPELLQFTAASTTTNTEAFIDHRVERFDMFHSRTNSGWGKHEGSAWRSRVGDTRLSARILVSKNTPRRPSR
jgi:hypothetical protein